MTVVLLGLKTSCPMPSQAGLYLDYHVPCPLAEFMIHGFTSPLQMFRKVIRSVFAHSPHNHQRHFRIPP